MADLRSCDLCTTVRPRSAPWYFVTDGKAEPSDWSLPKHWCSDCMASIQEIMAEVTGVTKAG